MVISDMTDPYGDREREEPLDGEQGEAEPYDEEDSPFAEEQARENAGELLQDDELPLTDEEARLPWLEGDEDDEYQGGYSTGQTLGLILAGLLVVGLVAGGIWWVVRTGPDTDLVTDGGTIASEGPYKQRPDEPGGMVFEGTGDSSFRVSEGQTNPARLGQPGSQPAPGFKTLEPGGTGQEAKPSAGPGEGAVDAPGVGVQVGAYSDRASAEGAWSRLAQQYGLLKDMRHRVTEGKADIGTVYRLQAVADNAASAKELCSALKASGLNCHVKQ